MTAPRARAVRPVYVPPGQPSTPAVARWRVVIMHGERIEREIQCHDARDAEAAWSYLMSARALRACGEALRRWGLK